MTDVEYFLEAHKAVNRSACGRWVQVQGGNRDHLASWQALEERWRALPLLGAPQLKTLALEALGSAGGPAADATTHFRVTLWRGRFDVEGGQHCDTTFGEFAKWLEERAKTVADKGSGWVACPTTNRDGRRLNSSTLAMNALNLDCDGRGSWIPLLAVLDRLDFAYIAYQSGGWIPTVQKWHLLIFLSKPFDTSAPDLITVWKKRYQSARVVFGALAELSGEGFDPTVETPSVPVFVTERRRAEDLPRQVIFHPGRSLDFDALTIALPEIPEEDHVAREDAQVEIEPLSDVRLEEIVVTLCGPMSKILSGRRDLYLALPGALLDRGVEPDDVRKIVEEISLRCPGDPRYTDSEIASKHHEHVHCTDTTIEKYERRETYLRIGTLVDSWMPVVRAIDAVLPNPQTAAILARFEISSVDLMSTASSSPATFNPTVLRESLKMLASKKRRSTDFHNRVRGVILGALLNGEDLVPRANGVPVDDSKGRPYDRESSIETAMRMVAFKFPIKNFKACKFFDVAIKEFVRPSLQAMLEYGEAIDPLMRLAEQTFDYSLGRRVSHEDRERLERIAFANRLDKALEEIED